MTPDRDLLKRVYDRLCKAQIFDIASEVRAALEASSLPSPGLPLAQEPKYTVDGTSVVNRVSGEPIPKDEPVFIMRARDKFAAEAIYNYALDCPPGEHREAVLKRLEDFTTFSKAHPERMKAPNTVRLIMTNPEVGNGKLSRASQVLMEADEQTRALAAEWLREDARAARDDDPSVGIRANPALAELLDAIADGLVRSDDRTSEAALNPVLPSALDASIAELAAFDARETIEPLSPSEGESLSLVLHELKRLRAQAAPATTPDPAVVSEQDLETLDYVEDLVRSNGFSDKADRLARLHEVLNRVAQGREASHCRDSYERAVQRLVLMRELVPAEALRAFEVEWRTRKAQPLASAAELNLPEVVRGELRQMAEHCGAVSYSPPPMRAVGGVSLTFEQLEALAVLISGAVWPVPGEGKR